MASLMLAARLTRDRSPGPCNNFFAHPGDAPPRVTRVCIGSAWGKNKRPFSGQAEAALIVTFAFLKAWTSIII
jgi:hypothetical protein